jgi:hypothetical protein
MKIGAPAQSLVFIEASSPEYGQLAVLIFLGKTLSS